MKRTFTVVIAVLSSLIPAGATFGQDSTISNPEASSAVTANRSAELLEVLKNQLAAIEKALDDNNPDDVQLAVSVLASELSFFQGKPTKADVEKLVATLDRALSDYAGDRSELSEDANGLIGAIVSFQGADRPETVLARAEALNELVEGANWVKGVNVARAWILLGTVVDQLRFVDPEGAAGAMNTMAMAVSGADARSVFRPPFEQNKFFNAFSAAHATLDHKLRDSDPVSWFESAAASLEALLVDAPNAKAEEKARNATLRRLILNRPSAMTAAAKAKAALEALTGDYRPAIHVVEAFYGDLVLGSDHKRVCNATQAMKALCERKSTCSLPGKYETALCGYDPIPAAETGLRRVAVQYTCHMGGDELWDELARYPRRDPLSGTDLYEPSNPALNYAILNGTTMEIRCPSAVGGGRDDIAASK
ncbi:MAG: hypothetical protein RIA09_01820 [Hoeflea sp.]|uniref:hypothetical protein n=1 Tax=Hoeflea sp. TaxID=1940281 RepID=UPI0032EC7D90